MCMSSNMAGSNGCYVNEAEIGGAATGLYDAIDNASSSRATRTEK